MEINPKITQDLQKVDEELNKLKKTPNVDPSILRSLLAAFEVLRADIEGNLDDLKRGVRVEKVDHDSL